MNLVAGRLYKKNAAADWNREINTAFVLRYRKGKDIPVTGRGGPSGCERSRLPHYLHKRLTDGGKVVSPTRRPPFTPRFLF
jgi:hypothetical protein